MIEGRVVSNEPRLLEQDSQLLFLLMDEFDMLVQVRKRR
jgi:hypothetical protein